MLIGYMRVSKADGSQVLDLQRDALLDAGVKAEHLYEDHASGKRDDRPGLEACLKALRQDDTLVTWKLDRLGRDLRHLVNLVHDLTGRGVGLKVLAGQGANLDTTTANGRLVFGIFAALAEFERELIVERTRAGLASARARGRNGGRPFKMTPARWPQPAGPAKHVSSAPAPAARGSPRRRDAVGGLPEPLSRPAVARYCRGLLVITAAVFCNRQLARDVAGCVSRNLGISHLLPAVTRCPGSPAWPRRSAPRPAGTSSIA